MPGKAKLKKPKVKWCSNCFGYYGRPARDEHGPGKCKKRTPKKAKPMQTEYYASLVNDQNYEPPERYNPITGTMDATFVVSGGRPGSNRRK